VEFKLITTGHADVPEAMIFRGGGLLTSHRQVFSGVLIRHPRATFLFEGGVGSQIQDEFRRNFNIWQRQLFAFVPEEPLLAQLASAGIDPGTIGFLILTHLHFDHAGVIRDFPGAKVRVTREEYDGALQAAAEGKLGYFREQFGDPAINWDFVQFNSAGFGPFARSLDLFGDGSIVLVPLPGHTAGGLGMFVTLESGERYFFIGDASWSAKAIMVPSERIPFARDKVDSSPEAVRQTLVFIHDLWLNNPGLHVMPAHDFEALRSIPPLIGPAGRAAG
jgi:glyoxylase-like metal-dependent hydrolase (beta-lactamase superfamily II)